MRPAIFFMVLAALALHCSDSRHAAAKASLPNGPHLDTLRQHFWQSRAITVIYPASMDTALQVLPGALSAFKVRMIQAENATSRDLKGSIFLIGTPDNNRWIRNTALEPAIRYPAQGILLNGRAVPEDAVVFLSFYPNPDAPSFPLFLVTAQNETRLRAALSVTLVDTCCHS